MSVNLSNAEIWEGRSEIITNITLLPPHPRKIPDTTANWSPDIFHLHITINHCRIWTQLKMTMTSYIGNLHEVRRTHFFKGIVVATSQTLVRIDCVYTIFQRASICRRKINWLEIIQRCITVTHTSSWQTLFYQTVI